MYKLPELKYNYDALAPVISESIMELHHSKHHAAYVSGANTALEQLSEARELGNFQLIPKLSKDLAFHLSGHVNHSIFWENLSPNGGGQPTGQILEQINTDFGTFEAFANHFSAAALSLQGSGWSVLSHDATSGKLLITQMYDQQNNMPTGTTPLLMLDMWEHAFYLDYRNVKADYVKAFWDIVNWENVSERLNRAEHKGFDNIG